MGELNEEVYFNYAKLLDDTFPKPKIEDLENILRFYGQAIKKGDKFLMSVFMFYFLNFVL